MIALCRCSRIASHCNALVVRVVALSQCQCDNPCSNWQRCLDTSAMLNRAAAGDVCLVHNCTTAPNNALSLRLTTASRRLCPCVTTVPRCLDCATNDPIVTIDDYSTIVVPCLHVHHILCPKSRDEWMHIGGPRHACGHSHILRGGICFYWCAIQINIYISHLSRLYLSHLSSYIHSFHEF